MGIIRSCRQTSVLQGCHLFHYQFCNCSLKVQLCLEHKGIRWQSHHINLQNNENLLPQFLQINPRGTVPVFIHDGTTVINSSDILLYIDHNFPDNQLKPFSEEKITEMKTLLTLADDTQEALFCLSLHFYHGNIKRGEEELQQLLHFSTARNLYEILTQHKYGFPQDTLKKYILQVHSSLAMLERKLREGRPWLVCDHTTLADCAWAPNVHLLYQIGFPMERYPYVMMWFDIVSKSSVFRRAVHEWQNGWAKTTLDFRIWMSDVLGYGVRALDEGSETIWSLPMVVVVFVLLVALWVPAYGIHYPIQLPKAMLLYVLLFVFVGSVLLAYRKAHEPGRIGDDVQATTQKSYMKALVLVDYGGPEVMNLVSRQLKPSIQHPDEVLVQVKAAAVNPIDIKLRTGLGHNFFNVRRRGSGQNGGSGSVFPIILGRDFSGVVCEIGSEVNYFQQGDEVYGALPAWYPGTIAEYITIKADWLALKPASLNFTEAATLPFCATTCLDSFRGLRLTNKRVLIVGAAGGLGSLAVQITKALGGIVTAVCSESGSSLVTKLGADNVVNYETHNPISVLEEKERFDVIIITTEAEGAEHKLDILLKKGGDIISFQDPILQLTSDYGVVLGSVFSKLQTTVKQLKLKFGRSSKLKFGVFSPSRSTLERISEFVDKQQISPTVEKYFKLHEFHQACKHVSSGHSHGKTVIRISE